LQRAAVLLLKLHSSGFGCVFIVVQLNKKRHQKIQADFLKQLLCVALYERILVGEIRFHFLAHRKHQKAKEVIISVPHNLNLKASVISPSASFCINVSCYHFCASKILF